MGDNMGVTTHDITVNGVNFIMELTLAEDGNSYMTLTEACFSDDPCIWFLNDSKPLSRWCCTVHQYEGDDHETEATKHPEKCEFWGICDTHQTYDFKQEEA